MWMLVSGHLLQSRGALFPALKATGLSDDAVRRAWAAFRGGVWQIAVLLRLWQTHIEGLEGWQYHRHAGYRAVNVDITAFYRPQLKNCPSKHYYAPAGKALPAVIMGLVGVTGNLNSQRLAVPRDILRVSATDPSEKSLQSALLKQVGRKLASDEVAVMDAGFNLKAAQQAKLKGYVVRLAKNFTARRNQTATYKGRDCPPTYGEWVRPLARTYKDNHIAATKPDRVVTWHEEGRQLRAEIWIDLILPGVVPDPSNASFQVVAIHDPLYSEPWLLATDLPIEPATAKALYEDRWPVEQIPLAAKHMVGAHRQFVLPSRVFSGYRSWYSWLARSRASWQLLYRSYPLVSGIATPDVPPAGCAECSLDNFFQVLIPGRSEFAKSLPLLTIYPRVFSAIDARNSLHCSNSAYFALFL